MTSTTPLRWKRVLVKLSGEALMGGLSHGLDQPTLTRIARDLAATAAVGAEIAVVVGGGNFFRGMQGADKGIERARADSIGMLATVMNALALEQAIEREGQSARALSAIAMPAICQPYSRRRRSPISRRGASWCWPAAPAIRSSQQIRARPCARPNCRPTPS